MQFSRKKFLKCISQRGVKNEEGRVLKTLPVLMMENDLLTVMVMVSIVVVAVVGTVVVVVLV